MKAVILAGWFGTRISEETQVKPKPMIEIGGKPILWHIIKIYSAYGINGFILCLGYKGYMIKEFFANNLLLAADVTIDLRKNEMEIDEAQAEPWRVTAIWSNGLGCITQLRRQAPCGYLGDCRL